MSKILLLLIFLVFCVVFFALFAFVLCLVYLMLPVSLDCPFLISPSGFSNVDIPHFRIEIVSSILNQPW